MPALPEQLVNKYMEQLHLPEYDARVICDDAGTIQYFETLIKHTSHTKPSANWMLGPVKSFLNDHNVIIEEFALKPEKLADIIELVESGKVSFSIAASRIFPALVKDGSKTALETATEMNLLQESDTDSIATWVDEVLAKMPDKVAEYKKGKKGLIGLFMGEVKKVSKGKADPKVTTQLLTEKLSQ